MLLFLFFLLFTPEKRWIIEYFMYMINFILWLATTLGITTYTPVAIECACALGMLYGVDNILPIGLAVFPFHHINSLHTGYFLFFCNQCFEFLRMCWVVPIYDDASVMSSMIRPFILDSTVFHDTDLNDIYTRHGYEGVFKVVKAYVEVSKLITEAHPELLEQITRDAQSTFGTTVIKGLPDVSFPGRPS